MKAIRPYSATELRLGILHSVLGIFQGHRFHLWPPEWLVPELAGHATKQLYIYSATHHPILDQDVIIIQDVITIRPRYVETMSKNIKTAII